MKYPNADIQMNSKTYEFGGFRLEGENLSLFRGGEVVALPPKACEVLLFLVERGNRIVRREEILEAVWANVFVEEANLTKHISALRKALGEDGDSRKFIETIPRRGYRFVAPVSEAGSMAAAEIVVAERVTARLTEEIEVEDALDSPQPLTASAARTGWLAENKTAVFAASGIVLAALIALAAFNFAGRSGANDSANGSRQPISYTRVSDGRDVGVATISPDGKFVAYIQNHTAGEGGTLFIRQLETNREMRLLEPDERTFGNIDFSPDGSLIYYLSYEKNAKIGAIYSISILGGQPKRLFNLDARGAFFAVSPGGGQIAFYRSDEASQTTSLIVAELDGSGSERVLHRHPSGKLSFWGWLAWSPDNRFLALSRVSTSEAHKDSRIFSFDLQTGATAALHEQGFVSIGKMCFGNPDGGELFFVGRTDGFGQNIYALDLASRQIRRVTNDTNSYGNYGLGITRDGKTLAADMTEIKADLWSVRASGDSTIDAQRVKPGDTNGRHGLAAFPDGRIAYTARVGDRFDVWSVKSDGSDAQPLTGDAFRERELTASKDGRFLVFSSDRQGAGGKHLYRTNADGSDLKQLTFGETIDTQPDFSPDGNWLVYVSEANGNSVIKKISVTGGVPIQLTDYYAVCPAFSPDGTRIALKILSDSRSLPAEIVVVPATGGKPEKIFPIADFEYSDSLSPIRWMPDGAGLVFRRERSSVGNLWRQSLNDSPAPVQLTDFTLDKIFNFVYSADGERILLSRGLYQTNSVLIQNF